MRQSIITQKHLDSTIQLLMRLIEVDTSNPPGNERALAEMLVEVMTQHGFSAQAQILSPMRANALGRAKGTGERPALLLNGHLDVVPPGLVQWQHPPFAPHMAEGRIWGRGAADMKSGLAAMLVAACAVLDSGAKLKGDLVFAGTAGEEMDSNGAVFFVEQGGLDGIGAVLVGEPSSCRVNVAEKGALWLEISVHGKTAHCAFPEQGRNAVAFMNTLLHRVLTYTLPGSVHPLLGASTLCLSSVNGGIKTNVVPDTCVATLDIRCVPGLTHQQVIGDIRALCTALLHEHSGFTADIQMLNDRPPVETPVDHPLVRQALAVAEKVSGTPHTPGGVSFYTDASVFVPPTGLPVVIYGPGNANMAHQPNEYVEIAQLEEALHFYAAFIEEYLVV